jgi:hypothetical protein
MSNTNDNIDLLGYDNTEENQIPADLAAILDIDKRDEALSEEDDLANYKKPWAKVVVLSSLVGGGIMSAGLLYMASQNRVSQLSTQSPDNVGKLTFDSAADSDKAALAVNSQKGQFKENNGLATDSSLPPDKSSTAKPTVASSSTIAATPPQVSVLPAKTPPLLSLPKATTAKQYSNVAPIVKKRVIPTQPLISKIPNDSVTPRLTTLSKKSQPLLVTAARPLGNQSTPITNSRSSPSLPLTDKSTPIVKPALSPQQQWLALNQVGNFGNANTPSELASTDVQAPINTTADIPAATISPQQQWMNLNRSGSFGNAVNPSNSLTTVSQISPQLPPQVSSSSLNKVSPPNRVAIRTDVTAVNPIEPDSVVNLRPQQNESPLIPTPLDPPPPPLLSPVTQVPQTPQSIQISPKLPQPAQDSSNLQASYTKSSESKIQPKLLMASNGDTPRYKIDSDLLPPLQPVTNPEIAEQKLINGLSTRSFTVAVGTNLKGIILTPIQVSGLGKSSSPTGNYVAVRLTDPLKSPDGQIILPANDTQIIFRFETKNGWISASSETLIVNGEKTNIQGLITMNGAGGQPLISQTFRPGADEVAAADRNLVFWAGVGGAGNALLQNDTTAILGNGSTTILNSSNRNALAGALQGSGKLIVDTQTKRNQALAAAAEARDPIYFISPGQVVDLFTMGQLMVNY